VLGAAAQHTAGSSSSGGRRGLRLLSEGVTSGPGQALLQEVWQKDPRAQERMQDTEKAVQDHFMR
jgi:hypothetical protein